MILKIDNTKILEKLRKATFSKGKNAAYDKAYKLFQKAKGELFNDFWNHNVTREIQNGAGTANISGTLDGYGDLFSFIGFHDGEEPIKPLAEMLEQTIDIQFSIFRKNTWYFRISLPNKNDIEQSSPMPWELGNSWVDGIENGMSNLSHFLSEIDKGRSLGGIQIKGNVNNDLIFTPIPYITEILNKFKERFE